ncbi:hypothetical protein AOA80_08425 [Methanomassiliicoccales archaeon RumEn M1]|jgi:hypothetical protein|nr:hypothetical protein AOA80_08425 [Methanomassiliicoccales archaeon RumEn M1]
MRRSPVILFLEPFVLLATAMAALLLLLSARLRRSRRAIRGSRGTLALQCCAIPCIAIAVLMPSLGPAAMLCFFGLSLVTIMRLQRDD